MIGGAPGRLDLFRKVEVVHGRLNVSSNSRKEYAVSVGEITRRLSAPESLNVSTVGAIMRRAKIKGSGDKLRRELGQYGVKVERGKRTKSRITLLTSLTEGEALELGRDFRRICSNDFPSLATGQYLARQKRHALQGASDTGDNDNADKQRLATLEQQRHAAMSLAEEIQQLRSMLAQHRPAWLPPPPPSTTTQSQGPPPPPALQGVVADSLERFGMLSHGLGPPTLLAALDVIVDVAKYQAVELDTLMAQ